MPAHRIVSGRSTLALLLGIVVVVAQGQCTGSRQQTPQQEASQHVIESDRAYLRLPTGLTGAEIQTEQVGSQLIRCYELQASSGAWDVTYVNLELVLLGERFRAQVGQGRANLSESFASCIDRATTSWSFDSELSSEGEVIPLEFGPKDEPIPP